MKTLLRKVKAVFFDYCGEIDDEERKLHIENLVNEVLPKGMFELVSENTMRYMSGAEEWKKNFIAGIRLRVKAVTLDKIQDWISPVY